MMTKLKMSGHGSLIEALEEWERGWLHLGVLWWVPQGRETKGKSGLGKVGVWNKISFVRPKLGLLMARICLSFFAYFFLLSGLSS